MHYTYVLWVGLSCVCSVFNIRVAGRTPRLRRKSRTGCDASEAHKSWPINVQFSWIRSGFVRT